VLIFRLSLGQGSSCHLTDYVAAIELQSDQAKWREKILRKIRSHNQTEKFTHGPAKFCQSDRTL